MKPIYRFGKNKYKCPKCGTLWYYKCDAYDCIDRCQGKKVTRKPVEQMYGGLGNPHPPEAVKIKQGLCSGRLWRAEHDRQRAAEGLQLR